MNEGYLGKFTFEGERAATDDHPVILHALPLASTVTAAIPVGALLKKVDETVTAAVTESVSGLSPSFSPALWSIVPIAPSSSVIAFVYVIVIPPSVFCNIFLHYCPLL